MGCKYCVMRYSPAAMEKLSNVEAAARPLKEKPGAAKNAKVREEKAEEKKDKDNRTATESVFGRVGRWLKK